MLRDIEKKNARSCLLYVLSDSGTELFSVNRSPAVRVPMGVGAVGQALTHSAVPSHPAALSKGSLYLNPGQALLRIAKRYPRCSASATALYRLYIGIADGMSIARVWVCRYSK